MTIVYIDTYCMKSPAHTIREGFKKEKKKKMGAGARPDSIFLVTKLFLNHHSSKTLKLPD